MLWSGYIQFMQETQLETPLEVRNIAEAYLSSGDEHFGPLHHLTYQQWCQALVRCAVYEENGWGVGGNAPLEERLRSMFLYIENHIHCPTWGHQAPQSRLKVPHGRVLRCVCRRCARKTTVSTVR